MERIIAHLDMDAFFAAVEERDRSRLKGRPIVVGADPGDGTGRGIVATANYAARRYGIKSAMPISHAWRASEEAKKRGEPEVVFIAGSHGKYGAVSKRIMAILSRYSEEIGVASIDEAYFDLSYANSYGEAARIAQKIKAEIKRKEKLTASIGIGPNKLIAKIASDMQKPDGLTVVLPKETEAFLEPLPLRAIPGIGPKSEIVLRKKGARVVQDLKKYSQKEMADMLGAWGLSLYKKIRGISDAPITERGETKSVGEQETFMKDTLDANILLPALTKISRSVSRYVERDGFAGFRTVVLTVRFEGFKTVTRSKTHKAPLLGAQALESAVLRAFMPFLDARENPRRKKIRLVGVRAEKLIK